MNAKEPLATSQVEVKHVLVPLDGSEFALQPMPTARALAERFGAEVHTVSAGGARDADRLRAQGAAALGVAIGDGRVIVADGDPSEVIVRRADELGGCVVCMSTHGRGRLGGAVVGSVARSVLQRLARPMIALGPMADNPGWHPRPRRWPEPLSVRRIVACVDGSTASEQVLPVAAAWAGALDFVFSILTVSDDVGRLRGKRPDDVSDDAEGYVDGLVQEWRTKVGDVDGVVVRDPLGPASGLRVHLDERPAGLVALTTHARSGLERALVGAAAADMVRASSAPCLVAPVTDR